MIYDCLQIHWIVTFLLTTGIHVLLSDKPQIPLSMLCLWIIVVMCSSSNWLLVVCEIMIGIDLFETFHLQYSSF